VIVLDTGETGETIELQESDAIRLLGVLKSAGDSPSWLAGTLRSALDLLDPGARWAG
jgi:hypothetical protein